MQASVQTPEFEEAAARCHASFRKVPSDASFAGRIARRHAFQDSFADWKT
jgi:hypothetical protein